MDYSTLPVFSLASEKMRYLGQRQAVTAQNIANVDTPGYEAQTLKSPDFAAMVGASIGKLALVRTNPAHLPQAGLAGKPFKQIERPHTAETHLNGNNVALEQELQDLSMSQSEYQRAVTLYRKNVTMFRKALGTGNSGGA